MRRPHVRYIVAKPFAGDAGKAMNIASTAFTSNNFNVTSRTPSSIEFTTSKDGKADANPLLGATHIKIEKADDHLKLEATLRGVWALGRLFIYLPLALGVTLIILLKIYGDFHKEASVALMTSIAIALVLPWAVLAPILIRWLKRRALMILANLLQSIITRAEIPDPTPSAMPSPEEQ